jgi:hypothetical protein
VKARPISAASPKVSQRRFCAKSACERPHLTAGAALFCGIVFRPRDVYGACGRWLKGELPRLDRKGCARRHAPEGFRRARAWMSPSLMSDCRVDGRSPPGPGPPVRNFGIAWMERKRLRRAGQNLGRLPNPTRPGVNTRRPGCVPGTALISICRLLGPAITGSRGHLRQAWSDWKVSGEGPARA